MSKNPVISAAWIKRKYWIEHKTAKEMAELRKTKDTYIYDLIKKYNLSKKKNGIKFKGKLGYQMPEEEKAKHRVQKHAKEVAAYKARSGKFVGSYRSINAAAIALGLRREHVRDCLKPNKGRSTAKGYIFQYKKYRGEIIIERRMNLDFTLPFEKVTNGLLSNLPDYPYQERIDHYNKKVKQIFEEIERR